MQKELSRLAVAHVVLIVYIVFSAAVFLKIRYGMTDLGHDVPHVSYVRFLKDYGFLLFIIPAAWSLWSFWRLRKPGSDTESFPSLYFSGVVISFGLVFVAVSTCLGLMGGTIVKGQERPRSHIFGPRVDTVEPAQKP